MKTAHCEECKREMRSDEWQGYFGSVDAIGLGPGGTAEWHCGCDGKADRLHFHLPPVEEMP